MVKKVGPRLRDTASCGCLWPIGRVHAALDPLFGPPPKGLAVELFQLIVFIPYPFQRNETGFSFSGHPIRRKHITKIFLKVSARRANKLD